MDLKTFLLARITEDEEAAKRAEQAVRRGEKPLEAWEWDYFMLNEGVPPQDDAERHVVKWWPARVLADCAAKRAIIEHCRTLGAKVFNDDLWNVDEHDDILQALAAVYADHTDYQPEWAQEASQA